MEYGPFAEIVIFMVLACLAGASALVFSVAALGMYDYLRGWFPMRKLIHRIRKWKEWRKFCQYSKLKQFLILFGFVKDAWFESFIDWRY